MTALQEAKQLLAGCLFMPVERIDDDADIHTLKDMDSLSFETLVMELEQRVGREIDALELLEIRCVRDVAALLGRATR